MTTSVLNSAIEIAGPTPQIATTRAVTDYALILQQRNIPYRLSENYLHVGDITKIQGWILHVSVIKSQMAELLDAILLTLISTRVPFKIVRDKETLRDVLDGNFGLFQIGKAITIYPDSESLAVYLAKDLAKMTEAFRGPVVLTDVHLGGTVYARYGAFSPILMLHPNGSTMRCIHGPEGEPIEDTYSIPFRLSPGIKWPFWTLANPAPPQPEIVFHKRYKAILSLKADPKGNVTKSLFVDKRYFVRWCVIKEGKQNMWSDDHGRDMIDRLQWQNEFHNALSGLVPMPKILAFFSDHGNAYLVMQYVKGRSLQQELASIKDRTAFWPDLASGSRTLILRYLLSIIGIAGQLHRYGYVHRDITPVNFMVNKRRKLFVIDNELAYSLFDVQPKPPFEAGTFGFMSPQQTEQLEPSYEDDIYALGATMLYMLTALPPTMFVVDSGLVVHMNFFTGDSMLSDLMISCLSPKPIDRPSLQQIERTVRIRLEKPQPSAVLRPPETGEVAYLINRALTGLVQHPTVINKGLWCSKHRTNDNLLEKEKTEYTLSSGFHEGIAGILYFAAVAQQKGFSVESCMPPYQAGWEYLEDKHLSQLPDIPCGLSGGAAGTALALAAGIDAGILLDCPENRDRLFDCLNLKPNDLSYLTGLAGQIAVFIQTAHLLNDDQKKSIAGKIAQPVNGQPSLLDLLASTQKKSAKASLVKYQAQELIVLLDFAIMAGDMPLLSRVIDVSETMPLAVRSFEKILDREGYYPIAANNLELIRPLLTLISLTLRLYQVTHKPSFKELSYRLLRRLPEKPVQDNLSLYNGIAAFGELYLQANQILGEVQFLERADWICMHLLHTAIQDRNGCYWQPHYSRFPTADLMTGNSGVILFLIEYYNRKTLQ